MIGKSKELITKIRTLVDIWAQYAPESKFGAMTLNEFKTAVGPSLDSRDQLALMRQQIKGTITARVAGDLVTRGLIQRVVAGIVADPAYGANSPMYSALNYITDVERASGLTHKSTAPATPAAPTTSAPSTPHTTSNSSTPSTN